LPASLWKGVKTGTNGVWDFNGIFLKLKRFFGGWGRNCGWTDCRREGTGFDSQDGEFEQKDAKGRKRGLRKDSREEPTDSGD
jgi:hypothetical protein